MRVAVLKGGRGLERQVSLRSGARVEDALAALGHEVVAIDVGAKADLRAAGVPTPDWAAFNALAFRELGAAETLSEIEANLGFPLVIKPAAGGSSLGVRFAASAAEVPEALVGAFSYDDRVLLERHVEGRELAISLINGIALPAVEALPLEADRFDFEARYEIGRTVSPADLGAAEGPILDAALRTWDVLGFDGFCRVDLILAPDGPQVLEANAIPGLTDTSLLPMAAEAAGLGFERLVERLVELALERVPAAGAAS